MSYSITGLWAAPATGFRSEVRRTAEGAWELAASFIADGMQEIEVHDDAGNLKTLGDLKRLVDTTGAHVRDAHPKHA